MLIVPTFDRLGIGWDEAADLQRALAYLTPSGLLFGLPIDESQTRYPMFSVALVYRVLGVSNLLIARCTSVVVGGLAMLGVFVYVKLEFGTKAGLLAPGLLALNPYYLSFARLAFTESDVYLACTLT
jgi:4-amino-4-deoxy-L-arabinose transferase-like glycosyltransferase